MLRRAANLLKFRLERFLLRGATSRLLFVAALIGLLSLAGGVLVLRVSGGFEGPGDAVWWAFLRLTDPGYLGDDVGTFRRVVSTFLTVAGYVVFLGALVAIMTQWLNQTIRNLESGYTPLAQNDHVLVVGWTTRTVTVVRELLQSADRVRRFLSRHGARRLQVVLLAEEASPELSYELRDRLGGLFSDRKVTIRSGSSLVIQHLKRVDFAHASAIVVPGDDADGHASSDNAVIKALLSMSTHGRSITAEELPLVVAEVFDARKVHVARRAYGGPIEVLASERAVSRLLAQGIRLPGLGDLFTELLSEGPGNELYVREAPELAGKRFVEAVAAYERAVPIGLVRRQGKSFQPLLLPPRDTVLEEDDRLVLLAECYAEAEPDPRLPPLRLPEVEPAGAPEPASRRILVVGWSHKVPPLLHELEQYARDEHTVDVFSVTPIGEREEELRRYGVAHERVQVRHLVGDRTLPGEVRDLHPEGYDHVLLLGSDQEETRAESDARTVTGYLILRDVLEQAGALPGRPRVVVELFDRSNEDLFEDQPVEVVVSPLLVGSMLAQIALRQELRAVYDHLFGWKGPGLLYRDPAGYGGASPLRTFRDAQAAAMAHGELLLGWTHDGHLALNLPRDAELPRADVALLVLGRRE